MGQWNDRYQIWNDGMDDAKDWTMDAWTFHDSIVVSTQVWDNVDLTNNFVRIRNCLNRILEAMNELTRFGYARGYLDWIIKDMTKEWDAGWGGAVEITWKDIIKAWWDAPIAGWGWTIQFIDFMRKAVWNEPMNIVEQESFM